MNGNNKNMIHDIIHASVDTFKDLHNDSKNFRENAKNNASTSNSSATIPTAQPLTSRFVNLQNEEYILGALSRHLFWAFKGLAPFYNLSIPSELLGLRVSHNKAEDYFFVKLFKLNYKKRLTQWFFNDSLIGELHDRCDCVCKNASESLAYAKEFFDEEMRHIPNLELLTEYNRLFYWNEKIYTLRRQYTEIYRNNYIFLNRIRFYGFKDCGEYVELHFYLTATCLSM